MKKGLTLVELLITMTVLGTVMVTFSAIYANSIKTVREEMTETQLQAEAQTLVDRMVTDIKKSRNTLKSYDNQTESNKTMILEMPAIDSYTQQKIMYFAGNQLEDHFVYYQTGNRLVRKVYADPKSARMNENGTVKTLSSNVTSLNFTYSYLPNNVTDLKVDIELKLSKKIGNRVRTMTAKGTGSFRNSL